MGVFDEVYCDQRRGQVKCWDKSLTTYGRGDKVPSVDGKQTYVIQMKEGGFLLVYQNKILAWMDQLQVFDKWGGKK